MTSFDFRFNLLLATMEWNLGNDAEKSYWSGYMSGLRAFRQIAAAGETPSAASSAALETQRFFAAGVAGGEQGASVAAATALLEELTNQNLSCRGVSGLLAAT